MEHTILKVNEKEFLPSIIRFNAINFMSKMESVFEENVKRMKDDPYFLEGQDKWIGLKEEHARFIKFWK